MALALAAQAQHMKQNPCQPASEPLVAPEPTSEWVPSLEELAISDKNYRWTRRLFELFEKVLKINIKLHQPERIDDGEIYLFNHFARFETLIPQYLIYKATGAYCRSIASAEFFKPDDPFSKFLLSFGAVPNRHPHLLAFLASEILRGRNVVVFPEGGIVKDRRVVDERGRYSIYSRMAEKRRKQHSGAAVLALALDAFKQAVLAARSQANGYRLSKLADSMELDPQALLEACERPTTIIPANITFYPIRVGENLLSKGVEMFSHGIPRRLSEELLIEGNILLKHTDMDIRLGHPVQIDHYWRWWERPLLANAIKRIENIEDAFEFSTRGGPIAGRLLARCIKIESARIRDDYMHRMYTTVSVNLSHLASTLVLNLLDKQHTHITAREFYALLYQGVKAVQKMSGVNLHRSLRAPNFYAGLPDGNCAGLDQFIQTTTRMELLSLVEGQFDLMPKLTVEHGIDEIRLENLVEVYANEITPLPRILKTLSQVMESAERISPLEFAQLQLDDERLALSWDRHKYQKPQYRPINEQQTATASAEPYLLYTDEQSDVGIVLVHGFLASPAELRNLGEALHEHGFTVYGLRLKGHGTSPWDLRDRGYEDWLESVRHGIHLMQRLTARVLLVGFSTGGSLSLYLGAQESLPVAGVCAISVPIHFQNPNMKFVVPLLHGANRLVRSVSSLEGIKSFVENDSENPDINYHHMPMRGLYELKRLVDAMRERLAQVRCPVLLLQGTEDPVVVPSSVTDLQQALTGTKAEIHWVQSKLHGIACSNIGETWDQVTEFARHIRENS